MGHRVIFEGEEVASSRRGKENQKTEGHSVGGRGSGFSGGRACEDAGEDDEGGDEPGVPMPHPQPQHAQPYLHPAGAAVKKQSGVYSGAAHSPASETPPRRSQGPQ